MQRSVARLFQVGAHVPHGVAYRGATMKQWPRQQLPANFKMLPEQRWRMQAMPRDTGKIPRDFVLKMLYQQQPCELDALWGHCTSDGNCVLDSKRHLRDVLKQCRDESFIFFEKDKVTDAWVCSLTRERYENVRTMVHSLNAEQQTPLDAGLRGAAAEETTAFAGEYESMDEGAKKEHVTQLRRALEQSSSAVQQFQRSEVDYLPYTDLNGKVKFMWWYDVKDVANDTAAAQVAGQGTGQLEAPNVAGISQ
jgi:hypothetical protein